jgi:acetyltransferase-like isoleucine patch superfamily enzyme
MKHGLLWKVASFIRFLCYKLRYPKAFTNCSKGLLGRGTHLFFGYPQSSVNIGERLILANFNELIAKGKLEIGDYFSMSEYSRIIAHDQIQIGHRVTIARFVSILDHDHHCEMKNGKMEMQGYDLVPIRIGNHVWIGDKVSILKGSEIGSNIIIAANSVVKGKLEDNGIYAGAPAKRIKDIQ